MAGVEAGSDWDARTYDAIASTQERWGKVVLDRLPLRGDETVIDAGCGSGRMTRHLLERLPDGHVVGVDSSPAMLDEARRRFADDPRITFVLADLAEALPVEPADAIFSNAAFHWVSNHPALYRNLAAALRPGGRLVAQCGGHGCIDGVLDAVAATGETWRGPWTFATAEEAHALLDAAGFVDIQTWLHPEPSRYEPDELRLHLEKVTLRSFVERQPPEARTAFIDAVARALPDRTIDFIRLNVVATRP